LNVLAWGRWPTDQLLAADAVCARVKIEIRQEVTLERQAFDAHMRINNGLTNVTLENVDIEVLFTDADGNPVLATTSTASSDAKFFISPGTRENIDDISGSGIVAPATSADIHWLIIPVPGASNGTPSGTLYYVGAWLRYTIAGEQHETEVTPDFIYVKPMPMLTMDYFIPRFVYGDDPGTHEIEPIEPYSLGVRVKNNGAGAARALKIESAQPKIIGNDSGLLINFQIEGSRVNGEEATPSLLCDFGDIDANAAGVGRWIMTSSLSGEFIDFDATFTHADELGGALTSLLEATNSHLMVGDVLVDLPGSDSVEDFLGLDGDAIRLYRSNGDDVDVTDQSAAATLTDQGTSGLDHVYALNTPATAGFMYVQMRDPFGGQRAIAGATRSDGKAIKPANVWLSKYRAAGTSWDHWVNIFDANTTGQYTLRFVDLSHLPQAPTMQFINDRDVVEGNILSFLVEADDPNGTTPVITTSILPPGATFLDQGNGTGIFEWRTILGQAGVYDITFKASDGALDISRRSRVTVLSLADTDGDGMEDAWEMEQFGHLDNDGSGDADGDGISDYREYLLGTDPNREDNAPTVPVIQSPEETAEIESLQPALTVANSTDADGDAIVYTFEVFADATLQELVALGEDIAAGASTTTWTVPETLEDDQAYYWRVRAGDGRAQSLWAYGSFWTNTANDAPDPPRASFPAADTAVALTSSVFVVDNGTDRDGDDVSYIFEIFTDETLTDLVAASPQLAAGLDGTTTWSGATLPALADTATYYWRARAVDEHGAESLSAAVAFTVDTANFTPEPPAIAAPLINEVVNSVDMDLSVTNGSDADGHALSYIFEIDNSPRFDTAAKMGSEPITEGVGTTTWSVTGLDENSHYYWRAKTSDGRAESAWVLGGFRVSALNEAAPVPAVRNPGQAAWAGSLTPVLQAAAVPDPEDDSLVYRFEVYTDEAMTQGVFTGEAFVPEITVDPALEDNTLYYWRVSSVDTKGLSSGWQDTGQFFVRELDIAPPKTLNVAVVNDSGDPLVGIRVHAFTEASAYTGLNAATDENGRAAFARESFAEGTYRFRIDYLGSQFWTADISLPQTPGVTLVIDHETAAVTVTTAAGAAQGVRVYLFSEAGAYLGRNALTDASGQVSFNLPAGQCFKFRADLVGSHYWSDATTITADIANEVGIEAGGGAYRVNLLESAATPLDGIKVYLFSEAGSYLGLNRTTDAAGQAVFDVPTGRYKVRADYPGYQFWSAVAEVTTDLVQDLLIAHQDITITVGGHFQGTTTPLAGLTCYLFTPAGNYLNVNAITDAAGQVVFRLPEREYRVRADFMSQQFWSDIFTWSDTALDIPMADAEAAVGWSDFFLEGVPVYAFTAAGSYLGLNSPTAANGRTLFRLPVGDYKFRADYQSNQYWSADVTLQADEQTPVVIATGGGAFNLTVQRAVDDPIEGVNCYLFNTAESYIGVYGPTSSAGAVSFDLANGGFKFRVDHLGYQFWTPDFTMPDTLDLTFTLPHRNCTVQVIGQMRADSAVLAGVPVYLFTPSGSYLNRNLTTDAEGRVNFNLPEKSYRVRADYRNQEFWSSDFQSEDIIVTIHEGTAAVHVSGPQPDLPGVPVYVYTEAGSYLKLNATTDDNGNASFRLPTGNYRFRADYQGCQYWSTAAIAADADTPVAIDAGGGVFGLTVDTGAGALPGCRVYVFSAGGTYLGMNGTTDENGLVAFALADGAYKFRADHLGYQFWTTDYTIPDDLSAVFAIPHQDCRVTLDVTYPAPAGLAGVRLYLYTAAGAYMNQNYLTDANGQVIFTLPDTDYKLRADYLGSQFWSELFRSADRTLTIDRGAVKVTVLAAGSPLEEAVVYLYTEAGAYLGQTRTTDAAGKVSFILPDETFTFRVDHSGSQTWSEVVTVIPDAVTTVNVDVN
jgi:hypothetical protein